MKKTLFYLIAIVLLSYNGNAQKKVTLVDLPGVETALIIDLKTNNTFKEYYLFQYKDLNILDITKSKKISLIESNKDMVKIDYDGKIISFTIDKKYKNANETIYHGYGLSKRRGDFTFIKNSKPVSGISESISINKKSKSSKKI